MNLRYEIVFRQNHFKRYRIICNCLLLPVVAKRSIPPMSEILDDEVRGWVCRRTPHDNHDDACDDNTSKSFAGI